MTIVSLYSQGFLECAYLFVVVVLLSGKFYVFKRKVNCARISITPLRCIGEWRIGPVWNRVDRFAISQPPPPGKAWPVPLGAVFK
jgi:hypothetical protein